MISSTNLALPFSSIPKSKSAKRLSNITGAYSVRPQTHRNPAFIASYLIGFILCQLTFAPPLSVYLLQYVFQKHSTHLLMIYLGKMFSTPWFQHNSAARIHT